MPHLRKPKLIAFAVLLCAATASPAQDGDAPPAPSDEQQVPVAPEPGPPEATAADDPLAQAGTEVSDEELLGVQFERYKNLMQERVYDEAESVAKRIVELALRLKGPESVDFARALTNLAIVQHQTEQIDAARQNFTAAIEIIENQEDRLNEQLINPLRGLGAAQLEGGRPDLAATTFSRAVHLTHVNEGPHNLEQVEILESLAETNLRLGAMDEAKAVQDMIYAINVRYHADDSMALVEPLMRRAAWQHRAGFIFDERTTYRRIIRIIESAQGKDALMLVEPLTSLGQSFFYVDTSGTQSYQANTLASGEVYFKRALRIATENPESDWETLAKSSLALGDFYMFEGNEQRARKVYREVWTLLSEDESRHEFRARNLEDLVILRQHPIPQYVNPPSSEDRAQHINVPLLPGKVTVSYAVTERGRATDIKLIEAEPPEFASMQRSVSREIRRRVFRPQFRDGEPIRSAEQVLIHRFFYRQEDLDALRGESEAPAGDTAET